MQKSITLLVFFLMLATGLLAQTLIDQKGTRTLIDTSKWHLNGADIYNKNTGNIGIGVNTPNADAKLEVSANNKGILIPRLALTSITSAAPLGAHTAGMMVYNTATAGTSPNNVTPGFYYNNGSQWVKVANAAGIDYTNDAWVNDLPTTSVKLGAQSDGTTARTTGTEVVIKDDGKLGVGTDAPAWRLDVQGNDAIGQFKRIGPTAAAVSPGFLFTRARGTAAAQTDVINGDYLGKIQFRGRVGGIDSDFGSISYIGDNATAKTGHFAFTTSDLTTPVMVVNTGDGRVGIGTASPADRLHVEVPGLTSNFLSIANFYAPANITAGNASMIRLGVSNTTNNTAEMRYIYNASGSNLNRLDLSFAGLVSAPLSVLANGNVGIGETAPSAKLEVNGTVEVTTVNNVASDIIYKPLVWNTTTSRVETSPHYSNLNKTVASVASGASSGTIYTLTGTSAYEVKVYVENGCSATLYNKFVITGSNFNSTWVLNYIGGMSDGGNPSGLRTNNSTLVMTNPLTSGCADGGNTTAFNYTISVGASTGAITITNNGNIARTYQIVIEKVFD